jgi:hypothetical protein
MTVAGSMFFNMLATFAEFEGEPLAPAHARGDGDRPRERQAQRQTAKAQRPSAHHHPLKLHNAGERSIAGLAELLRVSRATIYGALDRARAQAA